jgi:hypothetical protein
MMGSGGSAELWGVGKIKKHPDPDKGLNAKREFQSTSIKLKT